MMFNSNQPSQDDMPTSRQLIKSTNIALIVATAVLLMAVLPAESGFDPTGIGSLLGLKEMGDIKAALEQDALKDEMSINELLSVKTENQSRSRNVQTQPDEQKSITSKHDIIERSIAPGAAIEIKLEIKQGSVAKYEWKTTNGKLNYNTHGDGYKGSKESITYKKGRMAQSDQGVIEAAFDGYHGWYWRNRENVPVSVKLEVTGEYIQIKQIL